MAIRYNEISVVVTGNVVKNNDEQGDSVLRMSEDQAREIKADLDSHFQRNPAPAPNVRQPESRDPQPPAGNVTELPNNR